MLQNRKTQEDNEDLRGSADSSEIRYGHHQHFGESKTLPLVDRADEEIFET
jgi:hypothetical protein